jgi:HEPN domain-containing protein
MTDDDDGADAPDLTGPHGVKTKTKDTLTKAGALRLARELEKYWHDQGYPGARFWTEPIDERFAKVGTYEIYRVMSNLVNGLPPRYRDE